MIILWCNYSCLIGTLIEYTKAAIYIYCENVGGGIGQGPATEVTHLGLNQPPVFFFPSDIARGL